MNKSKLPMYLRCCNASPKDQPIECNQECPYYILEEVNDSFSCPPDIEIDGKKYWTGCDYEKISEDAARYIESLEVVLKQIRWERDVAVGQLSQIGLRFGEKPDKIKDTLEKAEKYRWHDLRKNPEDLPENRKLVETIYHLKIHPDIPMNHIHEHEYGGEGFNKHTAKIVVAWRYVEPFMEEKE